MLEVAKARTPPQTPPLGTQIIASVRESCVGVLEVADAAFFVAIKMIQLIGAEQKFSLIFGMYYVIVKKEFSESFT